MYQPPAALKTSCAAKRMGERSIGGEVFVDRILLLFRRALSETVDNRSYVLDWVVHRDR